MVDVDAGYRLATGFGVANRAEGVPTTGDTVFRVGSISKVFTASSVMKLVDSGKIDLDAPVSDYLPELADLRQHGTSWREPTIRDLLSQHSGITSDWVDRWASENPPDDWKTRYEELPGAVSQSYMTAEPGTTFNYSNLSFSLLGAVVDRAARGEEKYTAMEPGEAFPAFVEDPIFAPLGMETLRSFLVTTQRERLPFRMRGTANSTRAIPLSGISPPEASIQRRRTWPGSWKRFSSGTRVLTNQPVWPGCSRARFARR